MVNLFIRLQIIKMNGQILLNLIQYFIIKNKINIKLDNLNKKKKFKINSTCNFIIYYDFIKYYHKSDFKKNHFYNLFNNYFQKFYNF